MMRYIAPTKQNLQSNNATGLVLKFWIQKVGGKPNGRALVSGVLL